MPVNSRALIEASECFLRLKLRNAALSARENQTLVGSTRWTVKLVTFLSINQTTLHTFTWFHPEISVWGGRGVVILQTIFLPPLPRAFSLGGKGIVWFSVS